VTNSIAVVIPCYNSNETLKRAIESIVNQSIEVKEIIVVDDCSDNSEKITKICSMYNTVKYIRNNNNIGLAGSRNVGIWAVKSNIIAFLDADDQFHRHKLEIQLKYLRPNNVVSTDAQNILQNLPFNSNANFKKNISIKVFSSPFQNLFFNRLVGSSLIAYASTLKKINGYDAKLRSAEDFDLWIKLLQEDINIIAVKAPLYLYYDLEGSLSKDAFSIWINIVISIKKFISYQNYKKGTISEQSIWMIIISKEFIKAEAINNKKLKNKLLQDIQVLLSNKFFLIVIKALIAFKIFKILSFMFLRIRL
jgi:glycosyltransferase involved in cell wall biosynthesis